MSDDERYRSVFISTPEGRTGSFIDRLYFRIGQWIGFDSGRRVYVFENGEKIEELTLDWDTTATIDVSMEDDH